MVKFYKGECEITPVMAGDYTCENVSARGIQLV